MGKTRTPLTYIAVIIAVGFVIITSVFNIDLTPYVTRAGVCVTALLTLCNLIRTEQTKYDLNNGVVVEKVRQAITESNIPGGNYDRTAAESVPTDMPAVPHPDAVAAIVQALTLIQSAVPEVTEALSKGKPHA